MVSAAGTWNCSPSGWNLTAFTPSPVGTVSVIVAGWLRAPRGMTSLWGPALMMPPPTPTVCVVEAYGRSEHLSSPVAPSSDPMRSAEGGAARGPVGVLSPQAEASASPHKRIMPTKRRLAFIGLPSPLGRGSSEGERGSAYKMHTSSPRLREGGHSRPAAILCVLVFASILRKKRVREERDLKGGLGPHARAGHSHAAPRTPLESPWAARTRRGATGSELAPTANTWRGSSADVASPACRSSTAGPGGPPGGSPGAGFGPLCRP